MCSNAKNYIFFIRNKVLKDTIEQTSINGLQIIYNIKN